MLPQPPAEASSPQARRDLRLQRATRRSRTIRWSIWGGAAVLVALVLIYSDSQFCRMLARAASQLLRIVT